MIGAKSVDIIDEIKEVHLHDFGIEIELHPDEEERNILEQSIQLALSNQMIDLNDAIDVRNIKNIKLANQLLKIRKEKKEGLDMAKKKANIEMQTQSNVQSSTAASNNNIKEMQMKTQTEIQVLQQKHAFEIERMNKQAEIDDASKQKLEMGMLVKQSELSQLSQREKQGRS